MVVPPDPKPRSRANPSGHLPHVVAEAGQGGAERGRDRQQPEVRVGSELRCPFCHDSVAPAEAKEACKDCMAWHHEGCWLENGARCATCGQGQGPVRVERVVQRRSLDVGEVITWVMLLSMMVLGFGCGIVGGWLLFKDVFAAFVGAMLLGSISYVVAMGLLFYGVPFHWLAGNQDRAVCSRRGPPPPKHPP